MNTAVAILVLLILRLRRNRLLKWIDSLLILVVVLRAVLRITFLAYRWMLRNMGPPVLTFLLWLDRWV